MSPAAAAAAAAAAAVAAASSRLSPPHLRISPSVSPSILASSSAPRRVRLPPAPRRGAAAAAAAKATMAVESATAAGGGAAAGGPARVLLEVRDLKAVVKESGKELLHGVDLTINEGEVHAIMGRNGSGKSTLSKVLVGHPDYEVTGGTVLFKGESLLEKEPEERSLAGLFMSFQTPIEIPGVSNYDFLLMALNARREKQGLPALGPIEFYPYLSSKVTALKMDPKFLDRNVNEGFSGGEKKRNEILQLAVLEADLAILDEIDSGLDVDALEDVANTVNGLLKPGNSILMITHYQRLLDYIKPTFVHIMEEGKIVRTGDISLAKQLEKGGYKAISGVS
ncbi:ABC transporter I family member 6, chloroplastic [Ananas comosus]|uniref:ABC transporter I family member 6, chloroplastic n=1 Tax=Ananas comosus TaxID=4615 RepID=A0A199VU39_ANACO|nr:ABC transporter I family member 6, chloroplastic [Ananas comosus]